MSEENYFNLSIKISDEEWEKLKKLEYSKEYKPIPMPYYPVPADPNATIKRVSFEKPCNHCGKPVHTENEEVFTIGYEPSRQQKLKGQSVKVKFFHKACFIEIAGEEYV